MLWIGRLNIAKMKILPKLIYSFNTVPVKISAKFFIDVEKFILKFILEEKGPRRAKTIFKKRKIKWEEALFPMI